MAASITTTATTLEGQFFEIANALQATELAQPEATRPNKVSITFDTEGKTTSISCSMSVTMTPTGATLAFAPVPYLP